MIYHLCFWYFFKPDASSFIGRMGIYGVSIFFILSGLSMAIVYHRFICSVKTAGFFFVRRIFRIWPLLSIATIASILLSHHSTPSLPKILLNLTGFFGFVPPYEYIATGAWSIGNEMFYYALTPLIIILYNYKKWAGNLFLLGSFLITLYFAFVSLKAESSLSQQWGIYIHPLNNLSLYTFGIAIYYNLKEVVFNQKANYILILVSVLAIIFYPVQGDQIAIVTDINRVIFILISLGLVIGFYKISNSISPTLTAPLEKLGVITYGVYILHPIVKSFVNKFYSIIGISNSLLIVVSIIVTTILFSLLSYKILELPLMKYGKKITS